MNFKILLFLSFLVFGFYLSKDYEKYIVKEGDSYYLIGKKFKINYNDIIKLNKGKKLIAGEVIKIPFYFFHVVKSDENLSYLAKKYLVDVEDIIRLNDLKKTYLYVNQTLKIPKFVSKIKSSKSAQQNNNFSEDQFSFTWPVTGTIKANNKSHNGNKKLGIFIKTKNKDTVYASENGIILYQGEIRGFGKTIFISHGESLISAYMGIKKYYVYKNQVIQKGQPIAKSKKEIFFSIFLKGDPKNPKEYFRNKLF